MFNTRKTRSFTMIAALFSMIALGWASTFVLAQPAAPRGNNAPAIVDRDLGKPNPGKPLPGQPGPLEPKPQPDPIVGPPVDKPLPPDQPDQPKPPVVHKPDFTGDASFPQLDPGHEKFVVVLSGRVLDDQGKPVPDARVTMYLNIYKLSDYEKPMPEVDTRGCMPIEDENWQFPQVLGTTDADGEYRLRITYFAKAGSPCMAVLTAERDGFIPAYADSVDLGTGSNVRDLVLARGGSISGKVVDLNGLPLEGISVWAYAPAGYGNAVTGADGRFVLSGVVGDEVLVYAGNGFHRMVIAEGVKASVRGGESHELSTVIELAPMATVSMDLNFLGEQTNEWVDGMLHLYDQQGNLAYTLYIGAARENGRFQTMTLVEGLAEGNYRIELLVNGDRAWKGETWINIRAGQSHDLGTVHLQETEEQPDVPVPARITRELRDRF